MKSPMPISLPSFFFFFLSSPISYRTMDTLCPTLICISLQLILVSFLPSTIAIALGNETDKLSLLSLKEQMVYDSNGYLSSWNDSVHFCQWQGVVCGRRHQRVTVLDLGSQILAGSISPAIGNLTFLKEVNFSYNRLNGNIPPEIGHLRRLQRITLLQNNLQGQIPVELANCTSLEFVILIYNNLTGRIPFQVGYMHKLIRFSVGGNNLSGIIPDSFGNLSSLNHLSLSYNNLQGNIPQAMGGNLRYLFLAENHLSGVIPASIYNKSDMEYFEVATNHLSGSLPADIDIAFPNLQYLSIGDNLFTGTIPEAISNIFSLQIFDIAENGFAGSIPDSLGKLRNLQELIIGHNRFGRGSTGDLSFLTSLSNCTQMERLAIHGNRFGGVLPDTIANLSSRLTQIYAEQNQISGNIPEGIGDLTNLTFIDLGMNFLTGTIPESIFKLKRLGKLFLHRNNLHGEIPSFIGNLTQLFDLYLHTNKFEGSIPVTLRNCTNMQNLYLSSNKLNGNIPHQMLGFLSSLIVFNVSYNSLTGPIPSDVGTLSHLVVFCVDNNQLSGEIPMELGQCSGLAVLDMKENLLQGNIPLTLKSLRSLERLDLSRNNLSGAIPHELQNLPNLMELNLSFNHLEGEVPTRGVFRNASVFSVMGNDKLCGGIPQIGLPRCLNKGLKRNILSLKVIVAIILSTLLSFTLIAVLTILWWRKKPGRKPVNASFFEVGHPQVSYQELLQATEGFASSNLIGVGSFGSVYKGSLHQLEKVVAIKVLNLQQRGASKSFMAECKALAKSRHRNLLKIITACSSIDYNGNDFKALVFDFMDNGNLDSWLHSRFLNLKQLVDIAIDMANALDYLHHHCEPPIVHCDLKPSNVLLDNDLVAHVADFGMAKLLSSGTQNEPEEQTSSSVIKGTIGYIAPEYGMGGAASPDADIYSYGILLLEMVTGKRPTDEMFHDGFNIRSYSNRALPEHVRDIVDPHLIGQTDEKSHKMKDQPDMECLVSLVRIGVSCSAESPSERMSVEDIIRELSIIKSRLVRTGVTNRVRK